MTTRRVGALTPTTQVCGVPPPSLNTTATTLTNPRPVMTAFGRVLWIATLVMVGPAGVSCFTAAAAEVRGVHRVFTPHPIQDRTDAEIHL